MVSYDILGGVELKSLARLLCLHFKDIHDMTLNNIPLPFLT